MKFRPVWKMVGVVALGVASLWAVRFIDRIPSQQLSALSGITVSVSDINATPTPSPTPQPTPVFGDQNSPLGTVAVQTFSGPVLVRQGAGTAVSVDGLILTTSAAAPFGSGSYIHQIATPRGQLLRARRVASDIPNSLVLLKTDANNLDAVLFSSAESSAGAKWEAVSAQIIASRFVPMRLSVSVVWSDEGRQIALSLDRAFASSFNGARLIDERGRSVGMLRNASQPGLVTADRINAFLDRYLGQEIK